MLVMALDHVRDFFHIEAAKSDPTDMATTTTLLFFTRWITHFCAPTFVFLSGTSAYLSGLRKSSSELSGFLIKRGFWLVLVEIVVLNFALTLNPAYNFFFLTILWAIGCSMIILGLLVKISFNTVVVVGAVLFLGHNVFDFISLPPTGTAAFLGKVFFTASRFFYPVNSHLIVGFVYAILPWTSVMCLGYGLGYVYQPSFNAAKRRKLLLRTGIATIAIFVVLRLINVYGDAAHWSVQKNGLFTLLSFLNTTKYPCSLLFLCMTLGPALVALSLLEQRKNKITALLSVYGRVPFFYFIGHFFLIRLINIILFFASGYSSHEIVDPASPIRFKPAGFGYTLPMVYLLWLCVIVLMYFPCRWFDKYKSTHRHLWWIGYL